MFLLAHSGLVGRTVANEILWKILSWWALDPRYEDLSHKMSSFCNWARRRFERPPRNHQDLWWWSWRCYEVPDRNQWSPLEVPRVPWSLREGDDGRPLPPPECWNVDPPGPDFAGFQRDPRDPQEPLVLRVLEGMWCIRACVF